MAENYLTQNAITAISRGDLIPGSGIQPILQVTLIKVVTIKEGGLPRYRLMVSDGTHISQAMLAISENHFVASGVLKAGSVIKVLEFNCSLVQDRMFIVLVNIDMVLDNCDIIGEPTPCPPYRGDENATLRAGGAGMPSQSMNQPATGNHVRPPYGGSPVTNSASRPNIGSSPYGGSSVAATAPRPNMGGNSYGGSAVPTYPKTDYGSGVSQAPLSNYSRPFPSYINQPPPSSASSYINQPPPMYANRGPVAKNVAALRIVPISSLNLYQGKWTIKARVTAKTELRTYTNAKGVGKVFSFDLLDSEDGEIRVTCFNDVADQFYSVIERGGVYMISRGTLKHAKKEFNHLGNEFEIFLDSASTVQPCPKDDESIPEQTFHFRPISDIEGLSGGSVLDVIGVVTSIDKPRLLTKKDGTETLKRTLQMKDRSGRSVEITMWGNFCNTEGSMLENMCDSGTSPILALKSGRVNDFNGKSVGTIASSQFFINPDFPEAQALKVWFDSEGKIAPALSLSRESNLGRADVRKVISQIKDENLGTADKPDWITVCATLIFIKMDNFCYEACPLKFDGRQCNKKVTNDGDGKYRCERCEKAVDKCDYRYILQMQIQDHTGLTWVTAFQESGTEIIGKSAEELFNLKHVQRDDEGFNELIRNVLFTKFNFKLKVKGEVFSDEERIKSTVVKAEKLNFQTETKFLLDSSAKLEQGDSGSLPHPKSENMISAPTGGLSIGNRETPTPALNYCGIAGNVTRESGIYTSQVDSHGKNQNAGSNFVSTRSVSYTNCTSCGGTGHASVNCPSLVPAPKQSYGSGFGNSVSPGQTVGGASGECFKCHQYGHRANNCPGTGHGLPAYGSGNVGTGYGNNASQGPRVGGVTGDCFKCHQNGHLAKDCPGTGNVSSAYGSGNGYGAVPNQRAGF